MLTMSTKLFPPLHPTNKFNKKKLSPPRVGESRKTLIFYAHGPLKRTARYPPSAYFFGETPTAFLKAWLKV